MNNAAPYYHDAASGIEIYHGDCRVIREWMKADVLVTDPPFGMKHDSGWQSRPIENDDDTTARDDAIRMWGDKPALVFGRWNCPHPASARMTLTWDKGDWPGMGDLQLPWGPSTEEIYVLGSGFVGKRCGSVIRCNRLVGSTRHPNEKPVGLLAHLIERCPAGAIADCFLGSGATLEACKLLGRRAVGIDINERYCEIAANRLRQGILFGTGGAA